MDAVLAVTERITMEIALENIKPINRFVLVRKCRRGDEGVIITPDEYKEQSNFVEIIAVGQKCLHFTNEHVGKCVQCPDFADGMHHVDGAFWIIKEDVFLPVVFDA